jgi:hypothetical protein
MLSPNCRRESVAGSIKVTRAPRAQRQLLHSLRTERKRKTRNCGATCLALRLVAIDAPIGIAEKSDLPRPDFSSFSARSWAGEFWRAERRAPFLKPSASRKSHFRRGAWKSSGLVELAPQMFAEIGNEHYTTFNRWVELAHQRHPQGEEEKHLRRFAYSLRERNRVFIWIRCNPLKSPDSDE